MTPNGFEIMRQACATCIYRKDSPLNLEKLENEVLDDFVGFRSFRVCHHHSEACCRGFWNRYKDEFPAGQICLLYTSPSPRDS